MRRFLDKSVLAILITACGPQANDDGGARRGVLVYETPVSELYREDRRIEVVALDPNLSRDGCGFLTDRAHDDLTATMAALDPSVDYGEGVGCFEQAEPKGLVYLEGFEHGPFLCDWDCCHADLGRIALVYFMVGNNLVGLEPIVDGEPYVALEPDQPCE